MITFLRFVKEYSFLRLSSQAQTFRCVCPRTWPAAPKRWRRSTSGRPGETSRTSSRPPAPASSSSSLAMWQRFKVRPSTSSLHLTHTVTGGHTHPDKHLLISLCKSPCDCLQMLLRAGNLHCRLCGIKSWVYPLCFCRITKFALWSWD